MKDGTFKRGDLMPGKRQPTDVVEANGRKHLTNEEKAARRASELSLPPAEKARPPGWMESSALRAEFRSLGKELIAAGLYANLDADNLGFYIVARNQWVSATRQVKEALDDGDIKGANIWSRIQDRFFKQARNCAASMGMTISDRCKLVIPSADQQGGEAPEDEFTRLLRERQKAAAFG